jgi:hypothetical protein
VAVARAANPILKLTLKLNLNLMGALLRQFQGGHSVAEGQIHAP